MRPGPLTNLDDAKRSLGREVRMLEGFVGVGIGGTDIIRLYVKDLKTPVARYVESNYGDYYASNCQSDIGQLKYKAQKADDNLLS